MILRLSSLLHVLLVKMLDGIQEQLNITFHTNLLLHLHGPTPQVKLVDLPFKFQDLLQLALTHLLPMLRMTLDLDHRQLLHHTELQLPMELPLLLHDQH